MSHKTDWDDDDVLVIASSCVKGKGEE